jgi:LemA protein
MIIVIAIVGIGILWAVFSFNSFVRGKNRATEAWADIEVQLKRRYDLIPNLVNTVKGYATHESTAFEKVTAARAQAMQGGSLSDKSKAEGELSGTLKSLFAITEAYPDLKANTNFLALQSELSDTENKIQAARRFYNGTVRDYNTALQVFPSSIIARMAHYSVMPYFDLPENDAAQQPVEVKF